MSMIPLLSESLMAFNGLVVVLVVVLMTSSLVARSRHTAGLLKALGMTTRQAATRVRWTILPPLILGTVLGCAVGGALIRPLLEVLLSGCGDQTDHGGYPTVADPRRGSNGTRHRRGSGLPLHAAHQQGYRLLAAD